MGGGDPGRKQQPSLAPKEGGIAIFRAAEDGLSSLLPPLSTPPLSFPAMFSSTQRRKERGGHVARCYSPSPHTPEQERMANTGRGRGIRRYLMGGGGGGGSTVVLLFQKRRLMPLPPSPPAAMPTLHSTPIDVIHLGEGGDDVPPHPPFVSFSPRYVSKGFFKVLWRMFGGRLYVESNTPPMQQSRMSSVEIWYS